MDIIDDINTGIDYPAFNLGNLLKLPFVLILLVQIFYGLMLLLRVRIMADTVDSPQNSIIKKIVYLYMFVLLLGSLLGFFLVLLG